MLSRRLVTGVAVLALGAGAYLANPQQSLLDQANQLHREVPLTDGHNDIPWATRGAVKNDLSKLDLRQNQPDLHTDIPRLRKGGVGAQFWSVYVPGSMQGEEAVSATLEQVDVVHQMMEKYPDVFELARNAADIERIFKAGKIASMIGMEGGHSIDNSLGTLRMFYRLGARYMTLTHSVNVPWADSCCDKAVHDGLAPFGEEVVREMNRLGMLVDISHVSPASMHDTLRVAQAPVIFSHSSARAINDHPRNVPDDVLRKLPANGGVVMVTFVPGFLSAEVREYETRETAQRLSFQTSGLAGDALNEAMRKWRQDNPTARASLAQVADHIDHIKKVAGINHVGIGGDFDGISTVPQNLEDVSKYPLLTAELLRRGYSKDDLKKVLGLNLIRVWKQAEVVAARLQKERPPSAMLFQK